eukprot:172026-Prymnesium_polylepis.1
MGTCVLHADMRAPENMAGHFEARLRDRLPSGSSVATSPPDAYFRIPYFPCFSPLALRIPVFRVSTPS